MVYRDGIGLVVRGLRVRQQEIEKAIFARVSGLSSDPAADGDAEYVAGLRATVAAAVDYVLTGIERGEGWGSVAIPREAAVQAHRAARNGVSLDTVMRRYMLGQALLWDYILEEADRVDWGLAHHAHSEGGRVREMLRAQASLVDRLVTDVAREHMGELERVRHSRGQLLLERVKTLLADGDGHADGHGGEGNGVVSNGAVGPTALDFELGYDLYAEHVGVIARGAGAQELLCAVADRLDRRLLRVRCGQDTVWVWLGGQRPLRMSDLKAAISEHGRAQNAGETRELPVGLCVAVGEPAWGVDGWRLTHRQAQAAHMVALRRPSRLVCYRDVALLASVVKDRALADALIEIYIAPLEDGRGGGAVLREALRAYLGAECNVSCAAKKMKTARSTIIKRLRTVEARLGRTLNPCPAELEVALALDEIGVIADIENNPTLEGSFNRLG